MAIEANEGLAVEAGFLARHAKALAVLRSLAVTGVLALATVIVIELITRGSMQQTYAYLTNREQPGWILGVFFLLPCHRRADRPAAQGRRTARFAPRRADGRHLLKQVFLTDPLYPTDLLFSRQILELMRFSCRTVRGPPRRSPRPRHRRRRRRPRQPVGLRLAPLPAT